MRKILLVGVASLSLAGCASFGKNAGYAIDTAALIFTTAQSDFQAACSVIDQYANVDPAQLIQLARNNKVPEKQISQAKRAYSRLVQLCQSQPTPETIAAAATQARAAAMVIQSVIAP